MSYTREALKSQLRIIRDSRRRAYDASVSDFEREKEWRNARNHEHYLVNNAGLNSPSNAEEVINALITTGSVHRSAKLARP